jgi:hypothetical protein
MGSLELQGSGIPNTINPATITDESAVFGEEPLTD